MAEQRGEGEREDGKPRGSVEEMARMEAVMSRITGVMSKVIYRPGPLFPQLR